jgi:hypothetical protein
LVNGVPISQAELDSGSYTFRDINANHLIEVFSRDARTGITLTVVVVEGHGHAMYSLNGAALVRYTAVLNLREGDNIVLVAIPEGDDEFLQWRDGTRILVDEEIGFTNLNRSVYLELSFASESSRVTDNIWCWIFWIIVLLLIALFLWWFLFYYRRTYDVIKVAHSVEIIGKDRVRRKRSYTFTVVGGPPIPVSYRIGEDGQWIVLLPNPANGEYTIPRGIITDDVTIEVR